MDINDVTYTDNPDVARSGEAFWFDDDKGMGLVDEIWVERRRQIETDYTHAHDDERGVEHLIGRSMTYSQDAVLGVGADQRASMIKTITLMVAAVETLDRKGETDA